MSVNSIFVCKLAVTRLISRKNQQVSLATLANKIRAKTPTTALKKKKNPGVARNCSRKKDPCRHGCKNKHHQ